MELKQEEDLKKRKMKKKISDLESELSEIKKDNLFLRSKNQRLTISLSTLVKSLFNFCETFNKKELDFEQMRSILMECFESRTFLHGFLESPPKLCERETPLRYCQILKNRTLEVGDGSLFCFTDAFKDDNNEQIGIGLDDDSYKIINEACQRAITEISKPPNSETTHQTINDGPSGNGLIKSAPATPIHQASEPGKNKKLKNNNPYLLTSTPQQHCSFKIFICSGNPLCVKNLRSR